MMNTYCETCGASEYDGCYCPIKVIETKETTTGQWIVTVDHADDVEAMFIPYPSIADIDSGKSCFADNGWTVGDFDNQEIYKAVYTYAGIR